MLHFSSRFCLLCCLVFALHALAFAHPGSGIEISDDGTLYIGDTGKGIWKLPTGRTPELISKSAPHWLALDRAGVHAEARRNFGKWFWRLTPESQKPAVIASMDYPLAMAADGTIYYVDTETPPGKVTRRDPDGKESVLFDLTKIVDRNLPKDQDSYATGITVAPDGSVYVIEAAAQVDYVALRKIDADGNATLIALNFVPADLKPHRHEAVDPIIIPKGQPVPFIARSYCRGLAVAEDGTIYVAASACGAVLALKPGEAARVVLQADDPWAPTGVTLFEGELYVLEFDHTGHDRIYWTPRVRKINEAGNVSTLLNITRD